MEIQQNEKDKKSKTYLMILIGALFALNVGIGINLWLGNKEKEELKTQNATLTNDKKVLQAELDKQIAELETMRSENQGLNEQLSEKDLAIEQKIKQIKTLLTKGKLSDAEFKKAKEEIMNLRSQIEDYKNKIAELTQKNEELTNENAGLNQSLSTEQARSAEKDKAIEKQSKTISLAKRLHASSISAAAVRERKMFGKKEVETDKANKVEEIRVKFSIDKNSISDAGDKDIFVKIIGPDGSPITTKMQTTKVDGTETLYTERKTIDYQNEKQDNVVYCKKQGAYPKGEYTVEIFTEGYKIGTSKFTLR
jgi:regulator of replication initiation timing